MWDYSAPSSLLLPIGDDYGKCEASHSPARTVGFEKILAGEYELHHPLSFSPPFQSLQASSLFSTRTSESNLGTADASIYTSEMRSAFTQFGCTQPAIATYLEKWMPTGGPASGDGSSLRCSKRARTTTTGAPQQGLQYSVMPRKQPMKAPCRRSQKLGDKITALQQLVSPYGKTDTASVLQEAATCIRLLHEHIQILTAPYPGISSASQQDAGEKATDLRRRCLCLVPISPAIINLVSEAADDHHRCNDMEDQIRLFGGI